MEPDVSMETESMIRIAVLPVGGPIPNPRLRAYVEMLGRHTRIDLSSISSFYSEHQKSPFANQPWETGSIRFKFMVGGAPASPWEDFQSNRKIHAVLGLCHCPASPNLDLVADQFTAACKPYTSALVKRCFAFFPTDSQLEDGKNKREKIILFPPSDQKSQEFHMLTMMQDLAATLLMEFEKWVLLAESSGTILKTPLDSQSTLGSEEVIKAKKRRLARAQKTIGDFCLLAGSPVDANAHFSTAIELARLTGDVFWHAGALEGSVCALLLDRMSQRDPVLEEEVKFRYYSVIQLYRRSYLQDNAQRVSTVTFELEAALKLARYLCRDELAKEVVELLTSAADGAKSLIDANDRLILYVEIARLFGSLGYQRKAAFFSRQVAQLYLQQDNASAAISAMQVLNMTTNAYHVQSKRTSQKLHPSSSQKDHGGTHDEGGKVLHQPIVSLFEGQWSTLQMVVLREILMSSVRAGDPLTAWSAAARLLRSFYPLITPAGQSGLGSSLANSSERLPSGARCADPALPFIRLHSFPIHPSQMDIIKRNPQKKEWWTGSAPTGPFIYTPFSKGGPGDSNKYELTWVVGEPVQVLVELANPCSFNLLVESIYLSVHSGNFDAFPVSVTLPPNTSKVILLSGIPTKVGTISIPGCIVHCFGVITEHSFKDVDNLLLGAAQGLVLSDPFRCCGSIKLKSVTFPSISIVPSLPLITSSVLGGNGSTILYEGEIRDIWISLTNAGTVPVVQAHVALLGKTQDSIMSIGHKTLISALPLKPGGEVTLPVTIKAWQLGLADCESDGNKTAQRNARRMSKEGSSPLLILHYAGPLIPSEESNEGENNVAPGRRLVIPINVSVLQGLRFVRARLLSTEFPTQVNESLSNGREDKSDKEATNTTDSSTEIDPYIENWGLRLLELELSNPTDVVFEVSASVQLDSQQIEQKMSILNHEEMNYGYQKARIDRDYSARVLIPLEHFKLPVLDTSFFAKGSPRSDALGPKGSSLAERNAKAELNASINNLISRIKVRWHSGRNSYGEMNIKEATLAALQASVMDILLPEPLTFCFGLVKNGAAAEINGLNEDTTLSEEVNGPRANGNNMMLKGSISANKITQMEVTVRNNTKELIKMSLSISCRDVAGGNCIEGNNAIMLWSGVLSDISLEVLPLQEVKHFFFLHFLVPGEYTLIAGAIIRDATDVLKARAKASSPDEPIFCRSSPFHVEVVGTETA